MLIQHVHVNRRLYFLRARLLCAPALLCMMTLLGVAISAAESASTHPAPPQRLIPADLHYRGAFAFPVGDEWAYSGHALAYYPAGDADGPADGYRGSLFAVGHAQTQQVGELAIPAPVISDQLEALPRATILQPLADLTGGWLANCTYDDGCEYSEVAGLAYLPNVDKVAWNLRDWYNVDGGDQDSLGWSDRDYSNAAGVWHIGPRPNELFHNARTSNYLFTAPLDFAETHLAGKWLIAGNTRPAGAFGGSQGPTLYATAPWLAGNPPVSGQALDALALLYYPVVDGCVESPAAVGCHYPGYRAADDWGGGAWIEADGKSAVVLMGRKGLGASCYGIPGEECQPSRCTTDKGWHADPYEPQLLFYDPTELAAVAAGDRDPWTVLPYMIYRPTSELFNPDCGILNAVAYDATYGLIYATESRAGPFGETVVHVWAVAVDETPTPTPTLTPVPTATPAHRSLLPWIVGE